MVYVSWGINTTGLYQDDDFQQVGMISLPHRNELVMTTLDESICIHAFILRGGPGSWGEAMGIEIYIIFVSYTRYDSTAQSIGILFEFWNSTDKNIYVVNSICSVKT